MANLLDFEISRVTPDQVRTVKDAEKLVAVLHAATKDGIYEQFKLSFAECFKDVVVFNSGIFQIARLRNDAEDQIIGVAFIKLRFGGSRDPGWDFVATKRQAEVHNNIFASGPDMARPLLREFTGDPILTRFAECVEARGQRLIEMDEDILGEPTFVPLHLARHSQAIYPPVVIEPVYILPQYQHVEGLAKALLAPVLERAIAQNVRVVAYNHRHRHDYSHPTLLAPEFRLLYADIRVVVHVDTKETPGWKGDEITWDCEFQWFTIDNMRPSTNLVTVESL
ncbi:hypothetical protein PFICI_12380 [Pestalotiopsis fici W106-1]|uniref:Uncharacterized protein n=1 Tax=Pestalotiopsis fici (strain W106-1 / CGMCC3.15140) TaxID=1229662 RepID=W3WRI5_PESFW|nr:uncharacterized protein PFICI_12380 [Pestalotiopsis fici W106-1]ETS75436.1 hypothetical protein PFICI_12380 [Pestalotiopsis fici W106-1]